MRVLFLNQCFHPDLMASGQQLTSLARELSERGHNVTVLTSNRGYDNATLRFAPREVWQGITIIRIPTLALGKTKKWHRFVTFGSFLLLCALRLLLLPRFDIVVALTSPPLISLLGALFVKLRGGRLFFWIMDLNPDEAIAAGWLKAQSMTARVLQNLLRFSLRNAERVIVLDRFMKQRVKEKGIREERIVVVPPWALDDAIRYDGEGRRTFREEKKLSDNFVVMYSGNHSPCHPLDTLLEAARRLSGRRDIAFCFVGGGSEQAKVSSFAALYKLENIRCLPYQPLGQLSASLSAADLHVVVMGEAFVGIIHPSKVYNILSMGAPFLYIGPESSPIADIVSESSSYRAVAARNGDVTRVVQYILQATSKQTSRLLPSQENRFSKAAVVPQMIRLFEPDSILVPAGELGKMHAKHAKA